MFAYTPDGFEKTCEYKTQAAVVGCLTCLNKVGSLCSSKSEMENFADIFSKIAVTKPQFDSNVNVENTVYNNVKVRVYTPLNHKATDRKPVFVYIHGDKAMHELIGLFNFFKSYKLSTEKPHPTQTDDCYAAVRYVLDHSDKIGVDIKRMVIAGDSAGGNAAACTTLRLKLERKEAPKIQVLLYPWLQLFSKNLPSMLYYEEKELLKTTPISLEGFICWYLGIKPSKEVEKILQTNQHASLHSEGELRKIREYLDIDKIPEIYKQGRDYYTTSKDKYESMFSQKINESSSILTNEKLKEKLMLLSHPSISPLFSDESDIAALPKTYFTILEWDSLKDQGILYAERLKKAGVDVHVSFFERAFHGIAPSIDSFQVARDMQQDLINYLKLNL